MFMRVLFTVFTGLWIGSALVVPQVTADDLMVFGDPREVESEMRIREALRKRVSLEFAQATLEDAVAFIAYKIDYPVMLDVRALADVRVQPDTEVTFHCADLPAGEALSLMLACLDLTWANERVILITSVEKAASTLVTRVYPVLDLVATPGTDEVPLGFDYDSLIELITTVIAPTTWDEVGGPGSVTPHELTGTVAISQTREVHEQVEVLLRSLRAARDWQGLSQVDTNVAWRKYFSQRANERQHWQENQATLSAPPPSEPAISPAQVESWQRPRVYE